MVVIYVTKEFERLDAEAQHLPLTTPLDGWEEGGEVKEEEEESMMTSSLGP